MNKLCTWFGHKYRARHDEHLPPELVGRIKSVDGYEGTRQLQLLRMNVYVCDVCTRCGHVVVRP